MNNTIKLAVASALIAAASSASAAGGIVAGDWTLDIGGVVNAYYTSTKTSGNSANGGFIAGANDTGTGTSSNITTGLLPNYLSVSGKTRQNDLDVAFTISIQPGTSNRHALDYQPAAGTSAGGAHAPQENRQAFLTFGDASWGSMKLGKDLGIYASDAILNDMTLLGVGSAAGTLAGNTTTLGRIGTGYIYADWKPQIAYTSPNFNGFSFTAGVTQAWNGTENTARGGKEPAFEGKASYAFAGDVSGKVWASGISQKVATLDQTASAWDLGANVNMAGFGATVYYGEGQGLGTTGQFLGGFDGSGNKLDSKDWYAQGTYTLPGVGTKLGVAYGESELQQDDGAKSQNNMWTVGAYHPLTKHLNLVAEYSVAKAEETDEDSAKAKTISLGAILFF